MWRPSRGADQVFYTAANGSAVNNLPTDSNIVQVAGQADTGNRLGRLELLTSSQYESDDHGFRTADGVQSFYFGVLRVSPADRSERDTNTSTCHVSLISGPES